MRTGCFNCRGKHELQECTLPINTIDRHERNRRNSRTCSGSEKHTEHYEIDESRMIAPGVLSATLKEALGMETADQEPSYLEKMRLYGNTSSYPVKSG
jgi:hypothetical protein